MEVFVKKNQPQEPRIREEIRFENNAAFADEARCVNGRTKFRAARQKLAAVGRQAGLNGYGDVLRDEVGKREKQLPQQFALAWLDVTA